jgi:flagellar hook-basal body complex protein FliE
MNVQALDALEAIRPRAAATGAQPMSFGRLLEAAVDSASAAVSDADTKAAVVAAGGSGIADAAIARAKADVVLEVVAVAASRISGAINTLLQTQV